MYTLIRAKGRRETPVRRSCALSAGEELEYLYFPGLAGTGEAALFTTRLGGTSRGEYASLNLAFNRGDEQERVLENYRRVGEALGITPEDMVCTHQTHTANIRRVYREDGGKGILRPRDYTDVDGLVTDQPGLALACFFADCVPLYFVDPVRRAIGLAHSGWRGTAAGMGARMTERMAAEFGSRPEDLRAAIGPSICRDCYEVGDEVAQAFAEAMERIPGRERLLEQIRLGGFYRSGLSGLPQVILPGRREGKYQLDLWLANLLILAGAGIPLERIEVTDLCTCCNPEYLFSHRASGGRRGALGAFLMLRKN